MPAKATPLALDHVALPMLDPVATRTFYSEVLGLTLVEALSGDDWGGRAWLPKRRTRTDEKALAVVFRVEKAPAAPTYR